jgi:Domain of unknown function (DUF4276)
MVRSHVCNEIRLYIEGGGSGQNTGNASQLLREGFSNFLKHLKEEAKERGFRLSIILCGSGSNALRDFQNALESNPNSINVLLIDSEAPVDRLPWQHLRVINRWSVPNVDDNYCHLMVQVMEAWLIADLDTLKKYYGQGFRATLIPQNPNVEQIDKNDLISKLRTATRDTSKGEYQKIRHASELLKQIDVTRVRCASSHCDRLFTTLTQMMKTVA